MPVIRAKAALLRDKDLFVWSAQNVAMTIISFFQHLQIWWVFFFREMATTIFWYICYLVYVLIEIAWNFALGNRGIFLVEYESLQSLKLVFPHSVAQHTSVVYIHTTT